MKSLILKNALVYTDKLRKQDLKIVDGIIMEIGNIAEDGIDCSKKIIAPAFIDPHVHFREPGYEHKETIHTGSLAAAKGGYTTVFLMPNLVPVPDNKEALDKIKSIIEQQAVVNCYQLASITKDEKGLELSDMANLDVVGFSDDGRGVANSMVMYEAMKMAKKLNKPIIAHCEDLPLTYGGSYNESDFTNMHHINGNLAISETAQVARDLVLAEATGVHYHVCHISCKETLDLIKYYKHKGVNVTCEVTPHHLVLNDTKIKLEGNYKMNPPVRSIADQRALINGVIDGSIDCIATDHAPHTAEEKARGEMSPFGIVGLETSFALLYTELVKPKIIPLECLLDMLSRNVAKAFNLPTNDIVVGKLANIVIIDIEKEYKVDVNDFLSMGKNTPFDGKAVTGRIQMTLYKGEKVWNEKN